MGGVEFVVEGPLIVLLGDLLRGQNSFLCYQQLSIRIKCDRGKHDVLCAIGKLLLTALGEYTESKAYNACQQALLIVSAILEVVQGHIYQYDSDDQVGVSRHA